MTTPYLLESRAELRRHLLADDPEPPGAPDAGEWRHRLLNGSYRIRAAGIFQQDQDAFIDRRRDAERQSRFPRQRPHRRRLRPSAPIGPSAGTLNATTDRTFNRDYSIPDADRQDLLSTIYLTGLSDRNYFDVRGYYFLVQRENTEEDLPGGRDLRA